MNWGVIRKKIQNRREKLQRRTLDKETKKLVEDSKTVTAKAEPGKNRIVYGKHSQKINGRTQIAAHIVAEYGSVKLSYINGAGGHHFVAAGKDVVNKIDLNRHFRSLEGTWDYDVYK